MEQNKTNPPIIDQVKEFIETKIKLYKYIAIDKTTTIASSVIAYAIIAVLGLLILFFASITLALGIGTLIGSYWAGFGIVTLIFILLAVLVLALKAKYIEAPLIGLFISKIFNDNNK